MTEVTPSQLATIREALRANGTVGSSIIEDPVVVEVVERMLEVGIGRDTPSWKKRAQVAEEEIASMNKERRPLQPASDKETEWVQLMFTLKVYNELGNLMRRFCNETESYQSLTETDETFARYFREDGHVPRHWIPLFNDFCAFYNIEQGK